MGSIAFSDRHIQYVCSKDVKKKNKTKTNKQIKKKKLAGHMVWKPQENLNNDETTYSKHLRTYTQTHKIKAQWQDNPSANEKNNHQKKEPNKDKKKKKQSASNGNWTPSAPELHF